MTTPNDPSPNRQVIRVAKDIVLDIDEGEGISPHLSPRPTPVRWDTEAHLTMARVHVAGVPEEQVPQLRETPRIRQWEAEARKDGILTTARKDLLRVLAVRLSSPVPEEVAARVAAVTEPEQLDRWFESALLANDYEEFRRLAQTDSPSGD